MSLLIFWDPIREVFTQYKALSNPNTRNGGNENYTSQISIPNIVPKHQDKAIKHSRSGISEDDCLTKSLLGRGNSNEYMAEEEEEEECIVVTKE